MIAAAGSGERLGAGGPKAFVEACEADERVAAAFLGGSFARGTADAYSDLDIYAITTDEGYDSFFADRQAFMRGLGRPVYLDDFNEFGFDMVLFTFEDEVEGELAAGYDALHAYTAAMNITFQYNRFGPPRAGAPARLPPARSSTALIWRRAGRGSP